MLKLKKPGLSPEDSDREVRVAVESMLQDISERGEAAVRDMAKKFDNWDGDFVLSDAKRKQLIDSVPERVKDDIKFAYEQVYRFAEAQRDSMQSFEVETHPGVKLGQRVLPVQSAGCYVPGGRYAHAASAIMSVATAKAAGVDFVVAASPPRGDSIDAAVCYAMDLAGADMILE
ncbi:MAG: sulfopropanediol 3-dehydrogenase, partial [Planctomycetota bacterium]